MYTHSLQMYSGKRHPYTDILVDTNILQDTPGHPHVLVSHLHIYTHTHPPSFSISSQWLFRPYPVYPPTLLPHGLGHLARCICVWRGRENLEKGRSKEREVGQRPWQVRGCPGHWSALGINLDTIWPPAEACSPAIPGPFVSSCFPHPVHFPYPVVPVIVSCSWAACTCPSPAQGSLQCPQGAPSSLLGTLTLRSSADTKLSEAANCSLPRPAPPPSSQPPWPVLG